MATCKDCLHFEACVDMLQSMGFKVDGDGYLADRRCRIFKDRSRFFEVPCKPWDKVWILDKWAEAVCEGEIVRLTYNGFTTPQEWIEFKWHSPFLGEQVRYTRIDLCVGKMLFFDREEAEAALAKIGGEKDG